MQDCTEQTNDNKSYHHWKIPLIQTLIYSGNGNQSADNDC